MFLNDVQRSMGFRLPTASLAWSGCGKKPNFVFILTDDQDQKDMCRVAKTKLQISRHSQSLCYVPLLQKHLFKEAPVSPGTIVEQEYPEIREL